MLPECDGALNPQPVKYDYRYRGTILVTFPDVYCPHTGTGKPSREARHPGNSLIATGIEMSMTRYRRQAARSVALLTQAPSEGKEDNVCNVANRSPTHNPITQRILHHQPNPISRMSDCSGPSYFTLSARASISSSLLPVEWMHSAYCPYAPIRYHLPWIDLGSRV